MEVTCQVVVGPGCVPRLQSQLSATMHPVRDLSKGGQSKGQSRGSVGSGYLRACNVSSPYRHYFFTLQLYVIGLLSIYREHSPPGETPGTWE